MRAWLLTALLAQGHAAGLCEDFSMRGLMRTVADGGLSGPRLDVVRMSLLPDLLVYYPSKAFLAGDPSACDPLKALPFDPRKVTGKAMDTLCRRIYYHMAFTRSLIGGSADFPRVCLAKFTQDDDDPGYGRKDAEVLCALTAKHHEDPRLLCAKMMSAAASKRISRLPSQITADECEARLKAWNGNAAACQDVAKNPGGESMGDDPLARAYVRECLDYVAYRKALRAGDRALCGDSTLCRVMMGGGPASLAGAVGRVRAGVCGGRNARGKGGS